jgi:hypothetical protein
MTAASPLLVRAGSAFIILFAATYVLIYVDPRLLNGVSVWEKPAKFFLSLGIHMATLAWGLTLLRPEEQRSRPIRIAAMAFLAAALFEMVYMVFQASRGEASHFNLSTPFNAAMYGLMGLGSLVLTGVTGYVGWRILRGGTSVMRFAAGWAFVVSAIATTLVAGYLAQGSGHWIGGDQTDATGLPFFHWSTTGGDLRVAHFAALHIMQAVPLIAWFWPDKRLALGSLAVGVAIVAALTMQALLGIPLLRA